MTLADWIVVAIIGLVVGCAAGYIIRDKRRGNGCIGCPDSKNCSAYKNGCCGQKRK